MSEHADLLARLLPPVSYDPAQPRLQAELEAAGIALDKAKADAKLLRDAMTPMTCPPELLDDWERFLGLPNCPYLDVQSRRDRCTVKINLSPARLDKDWFIWVAELCGYLGVTIIELDYFQLDWSAMDEVPMGNVGDQFVWVVKGLPSLSGVVNPAYLPGCGLGIEEPRIELFELDYDTMDDTPFAVDEQGTLQSLITTLKPAHTSVIFEP